MRESILFGVLITSLLSVGSLDANAANDNDEYIKLLKIAQARVEKTRGASFSANSVSSPVLKQFYGRYYKVGDTWDVAAWETENENMGVKPVDPSSTIAKRRVLRGGIFRYEVIDVKTNGVPGATVRVTPIDAFGVPSADPKVEFLTLTMTDETKQSAKAYKLKNHPKMVPVSPNGIRSPMTPIELLPLDVPEITTADRNEPKTLPELPDVIRATALRAGYSPSLSDSLWLEQDDFFGRPVEMLWHKGDPWPTYMRTSTGIALLLRRSS